MTSPAVIADCGGTTCPKLCRSGRAGRPSHADTDTPPTPCWRPDTWTQTASSAAVCRSAEAGPVPPISSTAAVIAWSADMRRFGGPVGAVRLVVGRAPASRPPRIDRRAHRVDDRLHRVAPHRFTVRRSVLRSSSLPPCRSWPGPAVQRCGPTHLSSSAYEVLTEDELNHVLDPREVSTRCKAADLASGRWGSSTTTSRTSCTAAPRPGPRCGASRSRRW